MPRINLNLTDAIATAIEVRQEDLSSQITEQNKTTYTFLHKPKNDKIILTLNGQTLAPGIDKDFALNSNSKTITILDSGLISQSDILLVTYLTQTIN